MTDLSGSCSLRPDFCGRHWIAGVTVRIVEYLLKRPG